MRISNQALFNSAMDRIGARLAVFGAAQQRLGSGKRIERPSDDPVGMTRALELRAARRAREQEARNGADGQMWINLSDSKLQGAVSRLQRARELAVRGAGLTNAVERDAMAAEIAAIRDDIVALANSRHQGRGLFAGYASGDAVEKVGGVWTFTGDTGAVNRRIGEEEVVQVNVTADTVFGVGSGADVFSVLEGLEASLTAGDSTAVGAAIADLDGALDRMLTGLATLGAAANRIDSALARSALELESISGYLSEIEDVDLAEAVMDLQLQEGAYQAALAAFARATQSSLIDFLR